MGAYLLCPDHGRFHSLDVPVRYVTCPICAFHPATGSIATDTCEECHAAVNVELAG